VEFVDVFSDGALGQTQGDAEFALARDDGAGEVEVEQKHLGSGPHTEHRCWQDRVVIGVLRHSPLERDVDSTVHLPELETHYRHEEIKRRTRESGTWIWVGCWSHKSGRLAWLSPDRSRFGDLLHFQDLTIAQSTE